ncbi:hypothetical protein OF83DRAFT_1054593 [Amylostereum chailletii]|nr:hypothetical protein OF83DRAFT_1054593 [Amylostereum chailletii]
MELAAERAQKTPNQKNRHLNKPLPPLDHARTRTKKEPPPPREVKRPPIARTPTPATPSEAETDTPHLVHGPIAVAKFTQLKKEIDALKKQLAIKDKTVEKQNATITELRRELFAATKSQKEYKSQLEKLTAKSKQSVELVSSIESTLQCQICMDILTKPFALGPCGHVLCQGCLQDWFRQAPIDPEDMDMDGEIPLVHRKKTCPVCRTRVQSRPLPLFVLKTLLSTLDKAKPAGGLPRPSPAPESADPWAGIFFSPTDPAIDDFDEDDVDEYGEEYSDDEVGMLDDYDNTSDDEYDGEWVEPSWEPPLFRQLAPLHAEPYMDSLLRRGATVEMTELYELEYSHANGLVAYAGGYTLYLGWNIDLADDDDGGERYIAWVLEDVRERPERWQVDETEDGLIATRLVRADDDGPDQYANSDTEAWIGTEEDED